MGVELLLTVVPLVGESFQPSLAHCRIVNSTTPAELPTHVNVRSSTKCCVIGRAVCVGGMDEAICRNPPVPREVWPTTNSPCLPRNLGLHKCIKVASPSRRWTLIWRKP
jgi:hypothetical protein